jgi:hypothetical protein
VSLAWFFSTFLKLVRPSPSEYEGSNRLLEGTHCLHFQKLRVQTVVSKEIIVFAFTNFALNVALLSSNGMGILNKVL